MITLDFDGAVLDRATGAADLFQAGGELIECIAGQRQSGDDRDPFTASTGNFAPDSDLCRSRFRRRRGWGGDPLEARLMFVDDHTAESVFGLHGSVGSGARAF